MVDDLTICTCVCVCFRLFYCRGLYYCFAGFDLLLIVSGKLLFTWLCLMVGCGFTGLVCYLTELVYLLHFGVLLF